MGARDGVLKKACAGADELCSKLKRDWQNPAEMYCRTLSSVRQVAQRGEQWENWGPAFVSKVQKIKEDSWKEEVVRLFPMRPCSKTRESEMEGELKHQNVWTVSLCPYCERSVKIGSEVTRPAQQFGKLES